MTSRRVLPGIALLLAFGCSSSSSEETADARPNVVLIVLDTLRRDVAGSALADEGGADWPRPAGGLTPHLSRLAEDAAVFTRAFSPAPWTVPAHASLFTGKLPVVHGCTSQRPRMGAVGPTLAELVAEAGYETAAFFSNPWLGDGASGVLRGFETRVESRIGGLADLTTDASGERGDQGGRRTVANVEGWLDERDPERPFLLFVNLLEAHLPYDPPAAVRARFAPPLPAEAVTEIQWAHEYNAGVHSDDSLRSERVRELYAADVMAVDALFGELLRALESRGVLDHAAVFVTSDHGENLGDHGLIEHQFSVHETVLAVPLVARLPGQALPPGRYDHPVSTADLFMTVLEVTGAPFERRRRHSLPLTGTPAAPAESRPIFSDYAPPHPQLLGMVRAMNPQREMSELVQGWRTVRVGSLRLTVGSGGTVRLHDLATDPEQRSDLSAERPRVVEQMRQLLKDALPRNPTAPAGTGQIDPEARERIEGIGYAAGDEDEDD